MVRNGITLCGKGHKDLSSIVDCGPGLITEGVIEVSYPEHIKIGKKVIIHDGVQLLASSKGGSITIGDAVTLSHDVKLVTYGLDKTMLPGHKHVRKPIIIRKGAWIAMEALLLGGAFIGQRAVIGARSVVAKIIPQETFACGNPVKVKYKIKRE